MDSFSKGYRTTDQRYAEDFAPPRNRWWREVALWACAFAALAGLLMFAARDAGGWSQLYIQASCNVFNDESACDRVFSDTGKVTDLGPFLEEPSTEYGPPPIPPSTLP